jgi:HEAT repeat protein
VILTLLVLAVASVLLSAIVMRRLQRDLREERSRRHRVVLEAAGAEDGAAVVAAACGRCEAQNDLLGHLACRPLAVPLPAQDLRTIAAHLEPRLTRRSPTTRARSALLAGRLGVQDLTPALVDLLQDPDPDVRLVACAALGELAGPRAAEGLIAALHSGDILPLRIVERLGRPWAVDTIVAALPGAGPTRPFLARALGLAGERRVVAPLAGLLAQGSLEERISAARALGELGGADAGAALVPSLRDPAWEVRAQSARALATAEDPRAVPGLERALSDANWWVRTNAAAALGATGAAGLAALERVAAGTDRFAAERARETLDLCAHRAGALAHA